jgi:DNA-binding transcriptional ArsR family regulator
MEKPLPGRLIVCSPTPENETNGARMELNLHRHAAPARASELARMAGSAQRASDFLKALAHQSRLLILCILAEGEKSVGELEDILNLRQPTVSQQLARLRADGLVSTRRDGKIIYYSLASDEARVVIGAIYEVFCRKPRRR